MRSRVLFMALGGMAAAACGLSVTGQLDVGAGAGDAGPLPVVDGAPTADAGTPNDEAGGTNDAGPDAQPDAFDATAPCDAGLGDASVFVIPAGGGACPTGTVEQIVQTAPTPVAGACTCAACTVSSEASCAGPNFQVTYAGTNSCGGGPLTYNPANNTCTDFNQGTFTVNDYHRWTARTPAAGACTAAAVTDPTKVASTPLRTCAAPKDIACEAQPAGTRLCIDSAAPCSGAFSAPVTFGDGASVTCAACGCTRTGTSCTVEYHANSSCNDLRYTQTANGICTQTNDATGVNHFKVYAAGLACNITPGAPTAVLKNQKTLCCTP